MSLFEFIFFQCAHYQIATYSVENKDKTAKEIFEMIIGTNFFITENNWIQSFDRSKEYCTKYQPKMCEMNIVYEYNDNNKVVKKFETKQGKKMLVDTNLILQYIDQRKLNKLQKVLIIHINMEIKYHHDQLRTWGDKYDFKVTIGNNFNWKVSKSTKLTNHVLYISSLAITNASEVSCVAVTSKPYEKHIERHLKLTDDVKQHDVQIDDIGQFSIVCRENILIDEQCSINMNECGLNGSFYDHERKTNICEIDIIYNGRNGIKAGAGGGYKDPGENVYSYEEKTQQIDAYGGLPMPENVFTVGFCGGCVENKAKSKGGNGGGRIVIFCNDLMVKHSGKITANGGDGINGGGGGSGGSILIMTNNANINENNMKQILNVYGGKGDNGGGDGSDGIARFGFCSTNDEINYSENFNSDSKISFQYGCIDTKPLSEIIENKFQIEFLESEIKHFDEQNAQTKYADYNAQKKDEQQRRKQQEQYANTRKRGGLI
eukprot:325635_1